MFTACSGKMSVEEAKQVTVSMSGEAFVPPPRRIGDILAILNQPGRFDAEIVSKTKAKADAVPPETNNYSILANFYVQRGIAARELGRADQVYDDIHTSWEYAEKARSQRTFGMPNADYARILEELGQEEVYLGNFRRGIEFLEQSLNYHRTPSAYRRLAKFHLMIGDYASGKAVTEAGIRFLNDKTGRGYSIGRLLLRSELLHYEGRFAEEEQDRRTLLSILEHSEESRRQRPRQYIYCIAWLAQSLAKQGRLIEAELEARRALNAAIGLAGSNSAVTARTIGTLGEILLAQGRLKDAEQLARVRSRIYGDLGASHDSLLMGEALKLWGQIAFARTDFVEAMRRFDLVKESLVDNRYAYEKYLLRDPDVILCLLKTGQVEDALKSITGVFNEYKIYFGERSYASAEMRSLRGMAYALMGMTQDALEDFSESVPVLLKEKTAAENDYLKKQRLLIIFEAYLDFLTGIHERKFGNAFGVNALATGFELSQAMIGSSVQSAVGSSGARAAIVDPELADLVRREQDALKQAGAFQCMLSDAIAVPPDQQNPKSINDLQAKINDLNSARSTLVDEIQRRFPKYADFTDPQPVTFFQVQQHLHPGEVLISIYCADHKSYVWAISPKGEVIFSAVDSGKKKLHQIITLLRKALDPSPVVFGDIPEFDLAQAYGLYTKLLKPVESCWENATDLLIVAHGPLGQLPFSILPTASTSLDPEKGPLFSNYSEIPWLIRRVSITRLPSAASFVALRKLPRGDRSRKAFVGFGDPIFNTAQLDQMKNERAQSIPSNQTDRMKMHVRGIRISETGHLDSEKITSCHLGSLIRLLDTAEEIRNIAAALNADSSRDVFTGERASEHRVKTMDLTDRQVIAFATHALAPGDLDGLDQPALALCSPSITGDAEDGLLTMGEIMKLRMNADWVILSACNTGAADGAGAEAASGLGRAFFYAGTRAILVSMWPVETTSARLLTTGLFRYQQKDKKLSRARALQKSMLALIDGAGLKDDLTGKVIASYAHPIFWAPFIVVGESGCNAN
jgi:CHAT domain-containing protein